MCACYCIDGSCRGEKAGEPATRTHTHNYSRFVPNPQLISAIISAAVPVEGDQGWTSFVMLILELQFVVWMGYYSDRNAGDAVAELAVRDGEGRGKSGEGRWAVNGPAVLESSALAHGPESNPRPPPLRSAA